jgi:hypothetical protein
MENQAGPCSGHAVGAHDHLLAVQDSNVTPPVCLTAFAAAAIAETGPMATGLTAWKIAKGLYVVPLLFAYTPFLAGDFWLSLWIFAFGTVGIYALTAAISGWMDAPLSWPERVLLGATGTALLCRPGLWSTCRAFFSSSRCSRSTSGAAAGAGLSRPQPEEAFQRLALCLKANGYSLSPALARARRE